MVILEARANGWRSFVSVLLRVKVPDGGNTTLEIYFDGPERPDRLLPGVLIEAELNLQSINSDALHLVHDMVSSDGQFRDELDVFPQYRENP